MNSTKTVAFVAVMLAAATLTLAAASGATSPMNASLNASAQSLDLSKVTASWNLSFLFKDKDAATAEYRRLNQTSEEINRTFRPKF